MISPALKALLAAIRSKEAPKGYGQIYGGAKLPKGTPTDVSIMPLNSVLALQRKMLDNGSRSTACGGYQFIRATLLATIKEMGLTGKEVWTPDLQDRMAVHLLEKRRLSAYMAGAITAEAFANNLAMEWASLPVVTAIRGHKGFILEPGMSYYEGDGLNAALHDARTFLTLVKALHVEAPAEPVSPPTKPVEPVRPAIGDAAPPVPAPAPRKGFMAWLKGLFSWLR
ncbi:hypothetical protein [Taklimakanibacter deserti]|uniref:hypothetical protein n=1 Tax=Taklimakanibacter deserti TaxID=2267839 RepID=UPI000E65C45E